MAVYWNGSTRNVADPQRAHEFEPRKSAQIFGVPFPEGGVLRFLANDGVFHDRIAEVVDYSCDGKHATEAFVKGLLLRVCCRPSEEHGDDCGDLQSEMLHETTPLTMTCMAWGARPHLNLLMIPHEVNASLGAGIPQFTAT